MSKKRRNDILARATWTFSQAFLATFIVLAPGILSAPNLGQAKALVVAALISSGAAGVSALKTYLLPVTKKYLHDKIFQWYK